MERRPTEFTLFPRLPPELRRSIWRMCLPHRVIEIDYPVDTYRFSYCNRRKTSDWNFRAPIISMVCHESRKIALEGARTLPGITYRVFGENGTRYEALPPRWFRPDFDIVHTNYDRRLEWLDPRPASNELTYGALRFFSNINTIPGSGCAVAASATNQFMEQVFSNRYYRLYAFENLNITGLWEERKSYSINMFSVSLHPSIEQAASSGLFGAWFEERIKIVDARDLVTLEKYWRLWGSGPDEDCDPGYFFKDILVDRYEYYLDQVDEWSESLTRKWINEKYQICREADKSFDENAEIWLQRSEREQAANLIPKYNVDHSWVKGILRDMPEFTPTIMFRFCQEQCYISADGLNRWSVDMEIGPLFPPLTI